MRALTRIFSATAMFLVLVLPASTQQKTPNACSLATKAEIQQILGMSVGDGKPNPTQPTLCDYRIGDSGSLSFFVRQNNPEDNADKMLAELSRRKMQVSEVKGVGDRSFYVAQGYGMIQLNSFKGTTYVILTMMVPGAPEATTKGMAEKLMQKVLAKF
jgi:hypothetical protein